MLRNSLKHLCALAAMFVFALSVQAQADLGPQTGQAVGSSSSQLNISATAQNAIQIDVSTAAGGATVVGATGSSSTGVFSLNFGNVNGLGIGTPIPGVNVTTDENGATYRTPITLTPRFSGFLSPVATVTVKKDGGAGNAVGQEATREGDDGDSLVTVSVLDTTLVTATAQSGVPITRYVGLFISNTNGANAVIGNLESRLIYQVLVP